jgi:hypothetical protein
MMPPAITGTFARSRSAQFLQNRLHQFHMASGKDRQADHMHPFFLRRLGNLLRRQPDAVVDDLEADIPALTATCSRHWNARPAPACRPAA